MTPLLLSPILKPDSAKLSEAYEVAADVMRAVGNVTIRVPKFFQYDGSSLPMPAWPVIGTPFSPRLMGASVFHDWLYHTHQVGKQTADGLFHRPIARAISWPSSPARTSSTPASGRSRT